MKQSIFNIPGAVWVTLIVSITKWLSDSFPDQPWLPAIVIVFGMIAKMIQIYWPAPASEPPPAPQAMGAPDGDDYTWQSRPARQPSKFGRLLIG